MFGPSLPPFPHEVEPKSTAEAAELDAKYQRSARDIGISFPTYTSSILLLIVGVVAMLWSFSSGLEGRIAIVHDPITGLIVFLLTILHAYVNRLRQEIVSLRYDLRARESRLDSDK